MAGKTNLRFFAWGQARERRKKKANAHTNVRFWQIVKLFYNEMLFIVLFFICSSRSIISVIGVYRLGCGGREGLAALWHSAWRSTGTGDEYSLIIFIRLFVTFCLLISGGHRPLVSQGTRGAHIHVSYNYKEILCRNMPKLVKAPLYFVSASILL